MKKVNNHEDKHTELVFILDKSGSMTGLEKDTIGGFNSMLEKQKKIKGKCRVTTVLFDGHYQLLHDRIELEAVRPMTETDYCPGGSTALMDAVGRTIQKIADVQKSVFRKFRADQVMFVIITDGEENTSRMYSANEIKGMIEYQRMKNGWEFIFLGANIDAQETAERYGIRKDRAVNYVPDGEGTMLNYKAMADAVCCYRETGEFSEKMFDCIREDMAKRG